MQMRHSTWRYIEIHWDTSNVWNILGMSWNTLSMHPKLWSAICALETSPLRSLRLEMSPREWSQREREGTSWLKLVQVSNHKLSWNHPLVHFEGSKSRLNEKSMQMYANARFLLFFPATRDSSFRMRSISALASAFFLSAEDWRYACSQACNGSAYNVWRWKCCKSKGGKQSKHRRFTANAVFALRIWTLRTSQTPPSRFSKYSLSILGTWFF